MHNRGKPIFHTDVPGKDLITAVKDFYEELNSKEVVREVNSLRVLNQKSDNSNQSNFV
jgi:hypothetical protein